MGGVDDVDVTQPSDIAKEKRMRRWGKLIHTLCIATLAIGLCACSSGAEDIPPAVRVDGGLIQGSVDDGVTVYRGVPFAAPPVGDLRWRVPQPPSPWRGTLQTVEFKPKCMQVGPAITGMDDEQPISEDCLYLNLWTPAVDRKQRLPVMVWLYGGEARNGSASSRLYWGGRLARKGVVVVNLSYRLGAFGALAHPELSRESDHGSSGNYALLDMIQGLHWVQQNIKQFGGDPQNVTVFGHSAGGWFASKLVSSPLARGLFQRVIALGGADLRGTGGPEGIAPLAEAEQQGIAFASIFNRSSLADLRRIPAAEINSLDRSQWPSTPWARVATNIDGYVLPRDPYTTHSEHEQTPVDLLLGFCADEGNTLVGQPLPAADFIHATHARFGPFANDILKALPAGTDAEADVSQRRLMALDANNWAATTWARLHADSGRGRVFFYHFTHVPPFGSRTADHGCELTYIFDFPSRKFRYTLQSLQAANADSQLVDTVQAYLTNFARTGNPNAEGLPHWPEFHLKDQQALRLDTQPAAIPLPTPPGMSAFDEYMRRSREQAATPDRRMP